MRLRVESQHGHFLSPGISGINAPTMQQFTVPDSLPASPGILPEFETRFSGWHLGMGLPDTLVNLVNGLTALGADVPACHNVAAGMALWGFQAHPLAPGMAQALERMPKDRFKDHSWHAFVTRMASEPPLDDSDSEIMETWYATARQDDKSLILRFLTLVLTSSPKPLSWLGHCWQDILHLGMPEIPKAALDMVAWDENTALLRARLEAQWAFQFLQPDEAMPFIEALSVEIWGLWRAYAAGELLVRSGRKGQAKGVLAGLWKTIPWHVNLTLKLYELFAPAPVAEEEATKDVAILLYSWNKAELLAETLASLAKSHIGQARIVALDNGSTDNTPEVLQEARQVFGADRFHIETLPVNVGAPAARNWLLSLPEVRSCQWAAFLDDDIVLPQDWLLQLLGGTRHGEDIGAVGCRITAATPPFGLQSADYNLFPRFPDPVSPGQLPNRVLVFDNCAGSLDTGLFTYSRPCLSVSGCCHLISMKAVEEAGGFDLRYTPSQFDDLDRDLRSALAGHPAVYVGSLAVRHVQHSSLAKSQTEKQIGHVMGNKFKLDTKYTDDELIKLGTDNKTRVWNDLRAKHDFLVDRLGSGA